MPLQYILVSRSALGALKPRLSYPTNKQKLSTQNDVSWVSEMFQMADGEQLCSGRSVAVSTGKLEDSYIVGVLIGR